MFLIFLIRERIKLGQAVSNWAQLQRKKIEDRSQESSIKICSNRTVGLNIVQKATRLFGSVCPWRLFTNGRGTIFDRMRIHVDEKQLFG